MNQTARARQVVDGVLLLDKPVGITSNAALQCVKRLLNAAKAGHVGTLDPLASGLLPVCLGEATKFSTAASLADKSYDAEILLGVTTTTADAEGEVTSRSAVDVSAAQVAAVLQQFVGTIAQTPPMYSALKRDGKPLYAYARAGQKIDIQPRYITIYEIIARDLSADRLKISVRCSKGTYIRVLAEDIGSVLRCGATLAGLRRTMLGKFALAQAVTLAQIEALPYEMRPALLQPPEFLLSALPRLVLAGESVRRVMLGQTQHLNDSAAVGTVRLYDGAGAFLGLGEVQPEGRLIPLRLVATPARIPAAACDGNTAPNPRIA